MSVLSERSETLRLLIGLENAGLDTFEASQIAEKLDPVLVYFVFRYLRDKYSKNPAEGGGVLQRLVRLTNEHPALVSKSNEGEKDVMREWFDDGHKTSDYFQEPEEYVKLIVDKFEG